MAITLYDPVADVQTEAGSPDQYLETLKGKRVGYVFNQHSTGLLFWKYLEQKVQGHFAPSAETRIYKDNTWRPAPEDQMGALLKKIDYALVGIGA
jgi:hypothetical protein